MTSFMDVPGIGEDIVEHLVQLLGLDVQEAVLVLDVVRFQVLLHFLLMSIKKQTFFIFGYISDCYNIENPDQIVDHVFRTNSK